MKPTQEEIAERLDKEKARQQDKPVAVWRPTTTKEEKEERQKQIDRGEIPF